MQTTPTPSSTAKVMDMLKNSDGDAGRFISSIEAEIASWAAERQPAPATQQEAQP
jgi:hypothetical protein